MELLIVDKRTPPFSRTEESTLAKLAIKYKSIIENKRTDHFTNTDKAKCWRQIENEFNAACNEYHRPARVLKTKYENLKKRHKVVAREAVAKGNKGNLVDIQIRHMEEEHRLKLKHMGELQEIQKKKLEIEIKIQEQNLEFLKMKHEFELHQMEVKFSL